MIFSQNLTQIAFISYTSLFYIGAIGLVLNRTNFLKTIMSLEILLLSINLHFILFSIYLDDLVGHAFVIFILILSAVESSIGLAILSVFYEKRGEIGFDLIKSQNKRIKY